MDLLYSLALNLLLKLFLDRPPIQQPGPPPSPVVQTLKVEVPQPVRVPEWVSRTPEHGFVGISGSCLSIEEARQQAIHSAIAQIVQTMGAEYSLSHESRLEGNARYARHELREKLAYTTRWFVRSVNENIKETSIQEVTGKYLCFLLVRFPPEKIEKLRRLTIGPKAGARIVFQREDHVLVEVRENNGVGINLAEFEMDLVTRNQHADIITLFFRKMPSEDIKSIRGVIDKRVAIKDGKASFSISFPPVAQNLKAQILCSERHVRIILHGYDELGRPLSLPVNSF